MRTRRLPEEARWAALLVLACICIGALAALLKSDGEATAEEEQSSFDTAERAAFAQLHHLEASFAYERVDARSVHSEAMRAGWHRADPRRSNDAPLAPFRRDAQQILRSARHHPRLHNTLQRRLGLSKLHGGGQEMQRNATEAETNSTLPLNDTVARDAQNLTANNLTEPDPGPLAYVSPASLGAAGAEAFHAFIMSHENFTAANEHATAVSVAHNHCS